MSTDKARNRTSPCIRWSSWRDLARRAVRAHAPLRETPLVGRRMGGYGCAVDDTTHDLLTRALGLPAAARADLAASLIESLETDPADAGAATAWSEEVVRRVADLGRGSAKTIAWFEVQRMLIDVGRHRRA